MRKVDALIIRTENTARHDWQSLAKNVNTQRSCFNTEKKIKSKNYFPTVISFLITLKDGKDAQMKAHYQYKVMSLAETTKLLPTQKKLTAHLFSVSKSSVHK